MQFQYLCCKCTTLNFQLMMMRVMCLLRSIDDQFGYHVVYESVRKMEVY